MTEGHGGWAIIRTFFGPDHYGIGCMGVKIIDKTDVNEPTRREGFWTYKGLLIWEARQPGKRDGFCLTFIWVNLIPAAIKW